MVAKKALVEHLRDWPGVHCVRGLLDGEPVAGVWFDRTQEYWARQRREPIAARQFATEETVKLEPLPCWRHLSEEAVRQRVAELVAGIEAKAAAKREETRRPALGAAAVCAQLRHRRAAHPKKSPAPRFHAFTRRVRRELYQLYRSFVQVFREAAEKLRSGDRNAGFPIGSFPPGLPFVTAL
jgi:hypothetical protein